jgi:sister chromatid cohesion protein DCC1
MAEPSTYTLRLAAPSEQQTFRLVELPPELLSIIESETSDLSLTIKGKGSDDAVLCSATSTYALKAVLVSNSLLIVQPCAVEDLDENNPTLQISGQVKDIIEVQKAVPKLERINGLMRGSEWDGEDEDMDEPAVRDYGLLQRVSYLHIQSKRRRYTYEQVSGVIQASDEELSSGLKDAHVLHVGGTWVLAARRLFLCLTYPGHLRSLPPSQLSTILEGILTSLVARSYSPKHVPLDDFLEAIEDDHDLPREVVRGVMGWYGDVSEERWRADMASLVKEVGLGLLMDMRVRRPHHGWCYHI